MPRELTVEVQGGPTRTLMLERDPVTLGRSSENELSYPDDPAMSRRHLTIERVGDDWWLQDLGSKNGTVLNGERLTGRCRLERGDRISVGRVVMIFDDPKPTGDQTVVFVEEDTTASHVSSVSTSLQDVSTSTGDLTAVLSTSPATGMHRIQALLEAGRELAGHRPLSELFELILDLAVRAVGAQRGVLTTLEGAELVVRSARGAEFRISRAVRDQVINEKKSLLVVDASQDEMLRSSMTIVAQRVKSLMAVPLQTDQKVTGMIYLDMPDVVRPFMPEDLKLLTVLANVAAIRIEHARLNEVEQAERVMAADLEKAAEIQRNLLPREAPRVRGLDMAGNSLPCRSVGGDYFDYIPMPNGQLAVIVGDVAGKGMSAALLMSSLQARVHLLLEEDDPLDKIVTRLNRSVTAACPENRFITFFMAAVDPATGEFTYVNAGHNPPYLVRADGSVEALSEGGPILGILKQITYRQGQGKLERGDLLAMYSDGVSEAQNMAEEEYGEDRLQRDLIAMRTQPAIHVMRGIYDSVTKFMAGAPPFDDITLVVLRRPLNDDPATEERGVA